MNVSKYTHATIVPLVGGLPLGQEAAFGSDVKYILSYPPFANNDQHFVKRKPNVPYIMVDENTPKLETVDVIGTTCPCAGLSSLSPSANSNSAMNDWMYETAEYVLGTLGPKVLWGENAPRLASAMGEPVVKRLRKIGEKYGYTFTIYKTKSILHGLSQVRDRTFYFFWKGTHVPIFEYIERPHESIEDTIRNVERREDDPLNVLTNDKVPSKDDPLYRYLLEVIEGGMSHQDFVKKAERSLSVQDFIEKAGHEYKDVAQWLRDNGYDRQAASCDRMHKKLKSGGNIMRKGTTIPSGHIGAFVGHLPGQLTHPDEDRYLTIREAASIMKLPQDFILHGGKKNLNHLCQNVPVTTATDMASQIVKYLDGQLDLIETNFMIQDNKTKKLDYEEIGVQLDEFMV